MLSLLYIQCPEIPFLISVMNADRTSLLQKDVNIRDLINLQRCHLVFCSLVLTLQYMTNA